MEYVVEKQQSYYLKFKSIKLALYGLLLKGPLVDFVSSFCLLLVGSKIELFDLVFNAVGIALFVIGLIELLRTEFVVVAGSTVFFGLLWIYSAVVFPQNTQYLEANALQFYIYVLPFFWIGAYLIHSGNYGKCLYSIARIKYIIVMLTWLLGLFFPKANIYEDYMDASNALVIGLICVYYLAYKYKKKTDIVLSIVGSLLILLAGSRGVLLSLVAFWAFIILFDNKNKVLKFYLILLSILIIVFYKPLLLLLSNVVSFLGSAQHLVETLQNGSFFQDELRIKLYSGFWEYAMRKPFGYGIMGDRYVSLHYNLWIKAQYAHNIFLELMIDFGYVLGIGLSLLIIYKIIKLFKNNKEEELRDLSIVLVSGCFIKLLVSSSFWVDQFFFLLLSLLVFSKSKKPKFVFII